MAHRVFVIFLLLVGLTAVVAVGLVGRDYYTTPLEDRPFSADHAVMRPSGTFGHGLGILGASMIAVGVAMYSGRKRLRVLWSLGRLSRWLEVHIFLCLVGPLLVVYHTTFKAGGIAAIALWTMLSVMGSGLVGRFLYVLIPRNVQGGGLGARQIDEEFDRIARVLRDSEVGSRILADVDREFAGIARPRDLRESLRTYLHLATIRRRVRRSVRDSLRADELPRDTARTLYRAAAARAALIQRSLVLIQVERLFFYWHAVHLPFTAMMFITLAVHVAVAVWLGYRWVL